MIRKADYNIMKGTYLKLTFSGYPEHNHIIRVISITENKVKARLIKSLHKDWIKSIGNLIYLNLDYWNYEIIKKKNIMVELL